MSAIFGAVCFHDRDSDWLRDVLAKVSAPLARFGPDGAAVGLTRTAIFGRWLLVINSHDKYDCQPLQEGSSHFLFDGRLDNREALLADLDFGSERELVSDSQLAFAAWRKWKEKMPARLRGDYAFSCWEEERKNLWLCRDPLGGRPLYWARGVDFVCFATQAKVLQSVPGIARGISEPELCRFINFLPEEGEGSLFEGIDRVVPGHLARVRVRDHSSRKFFAFGNRQLRLSSSTEYIDAYEEAFGRAVSRRIGSVGGVCAQLSSGLDSGAVVAFAAEQLQLRAEQLMAFTAVPREGFSGEVRAGRCGDEGHGAAKVAGRYQNVTHELVRSEIKSPMAYFPDMVRSLGRPPLNPCNFGWFDSICRRASESGMKVMLSGGVGNATISYSSWEILGSLLASGRLPTLVRQIRGGRKEKKQLSKTKILEYLLGPFLPGGAWRMVERRLYPKWSMKHHIPASPYLSPENVFGAEGWLSRRDRGFQPYRTHASRIRAMMSSLDLGDYNASVNLHGLEMRDPTGDVDLIEFLLSLPPECFVTDGEHKWLTRRMLRDRLPDSTLRPAKRGLQAADWFESFEAGVPDLELEIARLKKGGVADRFIDMDSLAESLSRWPPSSMSSKATEIEYRLRFLRGLAVAGFVEYATEAPGPWLPA